MGITQVEGGVRSPYTSEQISAALGGALGPVMPEHPHTPTPWETQPWVPHWQGVDRANPFGTLDPHIFDRPLGGNTISGDTTHISAPQNVTINVDGAGDPHVAAQMVAANYKRVSGDMIQNLSGVMS